MTTDELGSGNATAQTLDLITQEITNRERDRILALIDDEIINWDEYTAPGDYRRGANKALRDLRDLINGKE